MMSLLLAFLLVVFLSPLMALLALLRALFDLTFR